MRGQGWREVPDSAGRALALGGESSRYMKVQGERPPLTPILFPAGRGSKSAVDPHGISPPA